MINLEYFFSFYMFIFSLMMFCLLNKHLICMIISLEFMMMSLIFNLYIIMINMECMFFMMLYFLIMSVCEGVLSLTLIIMLVRLYGNDYLNSLSLLSW